MKSSESSTTSMIDKKRSEIISPKSVKSDGNCGDLQLSCIRCFYCTKNNFMSLDQLTHHINLMHSHKLMKEQRKSRSEYENSSHHHHHHHHYSDHYLSCEFCLMRFSSSEKLIKHISLVHDDKMQSNEEILRSTKALSEQSNDGSGSKKSESKYVDLEEQPTDLSRIATKKIKIESYASIAKHFDQPPPLTTTTTTIKTPGTPDAFLCNQCNASLPSFELFRLHLKNHLEESYGRSRNAKKCVVENFNFLFLFYQGVNRNDHFELSSNNHNSIPNSNVNYQGSQKKLACKQCQDAVFDNSFEYEEHVEQHYTEFLCHECDHTFAKNEELQSHLLENHVRFRCTLCNNENLESIMSLKLHFTSRHSDKRCSACHESFRSERDFKNHIQTKHLNNGVIKCIFCRVTCSSDLEMHFHFLSTHVKQFR